MPSYQGVDFLNIDSFLSDEEKLVRQTVRRFVDEQVNPSIEEWNREGKFPLHLVKPMAELGFLGAGSQWLRRLGHEQRPVRTGDAGTRAGRQRLAEFCLRAVGAGNLPDINLRV